MLKINTQSAFLSIVALNYEGDLPLFFEVRNAPAPEEGRKCFQVYGYVVYGGLGLRREGGWVSQGMTSPAGLVDWMRSFGDRLINVSKRP